MMMKWLNLAPRKRWCHETADCGNTIVSSGNSKISEQTKHLLAVRDHRDKDAFAALFDHFAPRLKGFFMRSGCSAAFAEEIVQEVMLTLWRKSAQFDPHRAQASAWIYQIARNRHIDLLRKSSRPQPEEPESHMQTEPDTTQILSLQQEAEQLQKALKKLNNGRQSSAPTLAS